MPKPPRLRRPPRTAGKWAALALAVAVHAIFIAVLVMSIRWQNKPSGPVTAELYAPPVESPPPPAPTPAPEPAPPVPPAPVPPPPAPTPPVAKPETEAPDIIQKAKQEEARKRKEIERKEAQKREAEKQAEKKRQDEKRQEESRARQAREIAALTAQADREQQLQAKARAKAEADAAAALRARAEADWIRRIQIKVKGVWNPPPELSGNPEAVFDVVQLPTGEIIDVSLRKSSGVGAYDDSVQRAILKSSPLPRPERADLFQRTLTLKFRPQD